MEQTYGSSNHFVDVEIARAEQEASLGNDQMSRLNKQAP
jgi:hypothetical protein